MQSIGQITCGLNLGLIYSVDYSYDPQSGITMKLFFVRENGTVANYIPSLPPIKTSIQIGGASFGMYPVRAGTQLSEGRRVQWVEFVDDFPRLKNYHIVLPGRGCGTNVYVLGTQVDNRTEAQKLAAAVDRNAQQIKTLTQFPDYEYTFNDFLGVLRAKFPVQVNATYNSAITQAFEGSFLEVLSSWCGYYNLSFFFENGTIKIFDPTRLTINLPSMPADALSYETEYDITSTYGKTVSNWFQQDGNEYPLSQTSNSSGPINVRTNTLYPVGYEFNLEQKKVDLGQVAAAMYGQNYWFLYNYYKGTTSDQCGWTQLTPAQVAGSSASLANSVAVLNGTFVAITPGVAEERFTSYQQYGQNIAGRWYLSNAANDLSIDETYTWFNEVNGQIFNFTGAGDRAISLTFLTPNGGGANIIEGTAINQYYSGVNYVGNRVVYRDDYQVDLEGTFNLGALQGIVDTTYDSLVSIKGADSMDFSSVSAVVSGAQIIAHSAITIPQAISSTFDNPAYGFGFTGFIARYSSIPIKGIKPADYSSLKASQSEPDGINIVNGTTGPSVISNTAVLKTAQEGSYKVYCDKYSKCASASTPDQYFNFRFEPRQVSIDNQLSVTFTKLSNNSYRLSRDYGYINSLVNNPYLTSLAQARTFPTRRVSFALNYFYTVPVNFLSNGLVALSVSVGEGGITSSYSFSNEMLEVPNRTREFDQYAQALKNSVMRTYNPKELLT